MGNDSSDLQRIKFLRWVRIGAPWFLLVGVLLAGFFVAWWSLEALSNLDSSVLASTIVASGTFLVAVWAAFSARRRSFEEAHRSKKVEIYSAFSEIISEVLENSRQQELGKTQSNLLQSEEFEKKMLSFHRDIILWASPDVIKSYIRFRNNKDQNHVFKTMDKLFLSFRKNLGLGHKSLTRGELIRVFLRNPEEVDFLFGRMR